MDVVIDTCIVCFLMRINGNGPTLVFHGGQIGIQHPDSLVSEIQKQISRSIVFHPSRPEGLTIYE